MIIKVNEDNIFNTSYIKSVHREEKPGYGKYVTIYTEDERTWFPDEDGSIWKKFEQVADLELALALKEVDP